MTAVVVDKLTSVTIDGQDVGCVSDAFLNHRDSAAAIYDALVAWAAAVEMSASTQIADRDATIKQLTDELAATRDALATATGTATALQSQLEALRVEAQGIIDRLTARDAEREKQLADAQQIVRSATTNAEQARTLQQLHWKLSTSLMGNDGAGVAVFQEIRRMELVSQQAAIAAQMAALPTPASTAP